MTSAEVRLWGSRVGAVLLPSADAVATFEYDPDFAARAPVQPSPLMMPRRRDPYRFPGLNPESFRGLPGLLADSLPDRFGNALIDAWLATQGRGPESFDAVQRLCYVGTRGMGALEFLPAIGPEPGPGEEIAVARLVELASEVLANREHLQTTFRPGSETQAMQEILSVGTSAGGARAKAVIAFNESTQQVRSGQLTLGPGYSHWLLKFDGVTANRDKDRLADPVGYGRVEYAYHLMAEAAGVTMSECRLLDEGGRAHFMTRRFDRVGSAKLHMQSLGALAHYDFNHAGAHSYEQALLAISTLGLGMRALEQQFRRMAFNIVARNQDDHVKNIAFLMDRAGQWSLAPAFDVTYAYRPNSDWTSVHQMTANGKADDFTVADLVAVSEVGHMKAGRAQRILGEVIESVTRWSDYAQSAGVPESTARAIAASHRLVLPAA